MKNLENIELTNEFKQFCDIFNFTPEAIIQAFVNKVDMAHYMCFPMDPDRWANLFMMEYLIQYTDSEDTLKAYGAFGEKWAKMMRAGKKDALEKTKELLENWHKAVLEERINQIMLGDDDKLEE